MFRSRLELTDTLATMETEREEHASLLKDAEDRARELEGAVRVADEVYKELTSLLLNNSKTLTMEPIAPVVSITAVGPRFYSVLEGHISCHTPY